MDNFDELLEQVLIILDQGPKPYEEIVDSLLQMGLLAEDDSVLLDVLEDSEDIWSSSGGLYNRYNAMVDGVYLTHRLSETEVDSEVLSLLPDFAGLDADLDEFILDNEDKVEALFSGGPEAFDNPDAGLLKGPAGWLSSYSSGDLIAIQRVGNRFRISQPDSLGSGEAETAALAEASERIISNHDGIGFGLAELLLDTLCEHPGLFRTPVSPLSELVNGLNLESRGHWHGRPGDNWMTPREKLDELRKDQIYDQYGFNKCCISEFEKVVQSWQSWKSHNITGIDKSSVLKALSHGSVADGLLGYVSGPLFVDTSLSGFIEDFLSSNRKEVASAYYVRAMLKEVSGDAIGAEKDLRAAARFDPDFEPAILELAHYDADRGNYSSYLSRLRRCDPELVSAELDFAHGLYPKVSSVERNDPCPCGSGRKYKSCCLNGPKLSEKALRSWLMYRVARWMFKPHWRAYVATLITSFANMTEGIDQQRYISFVVDVAMFEAGGIDDYLELRGDLLSEHDLHLARILADSKRALYEIVEVTRGESMTLRDTLSGDNVTVVEYLGSLDAQVGDYILGRVIETEEGIILVGESISVNLIHRQSLLELLAGEYDPLELLDWLASTLQLPRMVNFDGDEIVLCKARIGIRSEDPDTLFTKLDSHFDRTDDDAWLVSKTTAKGDEMSGGWMRFEDGELVAETNSVPRLDWLLEELRKAIGEFEVIERSESSFEEAREQARKNVASSDQEMWPEDVREQVFQALDQRIEEMEDKWLTESIPALGGLTPRQALDDPTRKEDLFRLLNEFEREEQRFSDDAKSSGRVGGGFNIERLRAKLGL